jgi:hypothetical protein
MNLLYPKLQPGSLRTSLRIALVGAAVAGAYGAVHDQVSYTISSEYFKKVKFRQFAWADLGLPPRVFASEIGFLATWWVGLFAGWFLARAGLAEVPAAGRRGCVARSFAVVFVVALVVGSGGALLGLILTRGDLAEWGEWQQFLELEDLRGFVIVAYLHAAGYLGALAGLILAIAYVRRCRRHGLMSDAAASNASHSPGEPGA